MLAVTNECGSAMKPAELADLYRRLQLAAPAVEQLRAVIKNSAAIVIARADKHRKISTQVCPVCAQEGHDADAVYCKYCAGRL